MPSHPEIITQKTKRDRFVEVPSNVICQKTVEELHTLGGNKKEDASSISPLFIGIEKLDVTVPPENRKEKVKDINYMDNLRCGDIIDAKVN